MKFRASLWIAILGFGIAAQARSKSMLPAMLGNYGACVEMNSAWTPQYSSLKGLWHLNEATNPSSLADSSAAANTGYTGGATLGSTGRLNTDATFSGAGPGNLYPAATVASVTTFSVSMWFNTTSNVGGSLFGFDNTQTGLATGWDRHLYMTAAGKLMFGVYNGSSQVTMITPLAYNDGNWHHVVVTMGSGTELLYADGVNVANMSSTESQNYAGYWRIGGAYTAGWPSAPAIYTFVGALDDVAIWSTVLTSTDVQTIYSSATPLSITTSPQHASILDLWNLDETSGTTYADSSGHSRTLTANYQLGTTVGKYGQAAVFSSSYIYTTNLLTTPTVFSIAAWIKTTTTVGGGIVGFGNVQAIPSTNQDRMLYMTSLGTVTFGVYYNSTCNMVTSPNALNDGKWHHIVVTYTGGTEILYVDGVSVATLSPGGAQGYSGYWHIGGVSLTGWPSAPASPVFSGQIDEVAIWGAALTAAQVRTIYDQQSCGAN